MVVSGRTVELYPSARPGAPLVVLNGAGDEGMNVYAALRDMTEADFSLAAISVLNWADDLTPWPAPAAFRGGAGYAGRADAYLNILTGEILPAIESRLPAKPSYAALAGYSLAGLFALYAPYKTDVFSRIVSASGSVWYPGFMAFAQGNRWVGRPERAYLSLGDREANTRNAALRPVEAHTRGLAALWNEAGVATKLEMNPGGHFDHPAERVARGIAWLLSDAQSVR